MWDAQDISNGDNEIQYDDIDILFSQLETIEPPPSIIARILDQAKGVNPLSQPLTPWAGEDEPRAYGLAKGVKNPSQLLTRQHLESSVCQRERRGY